MAASGAKSPGALFRPCPGCKTGKIFREDTHELCIYCLHEEAHVISGCGICLAFPSGTRKDRALRVAARFSTVEVGKKSTVPSPSPSTSTGRMQEGDSPEPPPKKRALDPGAGGPRPTLKSSRPATHSRHLDSGSTGKVGSRWDVKQGVRRPPSTSGATPSPATEMRRQGSSTYVSPSTTGAQLALEPAGTGEQNREHVPPGTVPPLLLVVETVPSTTEDRPRVGHKTLPTLSRKTTPPSPEAWQQSLDLAMDTMKVMVEQHQKTLRKAKNRLAEQQEASKLENQRKEDSLRALLQEQQNAFREELRVFQTEAEQREANRSDTFRREMDDLLRRCEKTPLDPLHELQQRELAALKKRQEEEAVEVYTIDEEDDEEDVEGYPYDPLDDQPYDPDEEPPLVPADPVDEPEAPVDIGGLPRSPTPRPTPLEDAPSFAALIQRAASHFDVPLEKTKPSESYLLDKLEEPIRTVAALPIESLVWDSGLTVMSTPATSPAVSARIDRKYRVPSAAPRCFRTQPTPESIVSSSAKGTAQVPAHLLAPPTKEARRMDNVGKKILAAASAQVRTANYTAVLARYDREMWDNMSQAISDLPPDKREAANKVLEEGRLTSNSLVRAALDSADCGFRQMNNGVWLRRLGWLSSSSFSQEYHPRILDLPFDGEHVFGPEVDRVLLEQKTFKETIKAMSPLTRGRSNFRGNRRAGRRGYGQAFPQPQQAQQAPPQFQYQYANPFPQNFQQRGAGGGRQGARPRRSGGGRGSRGPKAQ